MKWPFPLWSPQPPTSLFRIPPLCVYVLAQMPVISPFLALFYTRVLKRKREKRKKRERSENSRRYYSAACMAPVILSFHLCFLLYWQMVVIRRYGNTVVKIVFTDFSFSFGIYDLMIIMRALGSWTEGHSASVVWFQKLTTATWEWQCSVSKVVDWVDTHFNKTKVLLHDWSKSLIRQSAIDEVPN